MAFPLQSLSILSLSYLFNGKIFLKLVKNKTKQVKAALIDSEK